MKGEKVINAAGGRPETLSEDLDEDQYCESLNHHSLHTHNYENTFCVNTMNFVFLVKTDIFNFFSRTASRNGFQF